MRAIRVPSTSSRWSRSSPGSASAPTGSRPAPTARRRPSGARRAHAAWPSSSPWRRRSRSSSSATRYSAHHRALPFGRRRLRRRHASCSADACGVVSGAALLVDYVLTITISIAAGADAIFSFLPAELARRRSCRSSFAGARRCSRAEPARREGVGHRARARSSCSSSSRTPSLLVGGHRRRTLGELPRRQRRGAREHHAHGAARSARFGTLLLFVRAYSLGGGTYTGIEAVSNGVAIMREPRVQTAQAHHGAAWPSRSPHRRRHPPLLPALSTSHARRGQDDERRARSSASPGGWTHRRRRRRHGASSSSRCSARARSSSSPRRPASSTGRASWPTWPSTPGCRTASPRSPSGSPCGTASLLMGGAAVAALLYTRGDVGALVVMYSINVFLTFSLSNSRCRASGSSTARSTQGLEAAPAGAPASRLVAVPHDPRRHRRREVRRGRLAHAGDHARRSSALCFADQAPLRAVVRAIAALDDELPGPEDPGADAMADGAIGTRRARARARPQAGRHPLRRRLRRPRAARAAHAAAHVPRALQGRRLRQRRGGRLRRVQGRRARSTALEERTRESLASYERFARSARAAGGERVLGRAPRSPSRPRSSAASSSSDTRKALVVAGQLIFEEDTAWNRSSTTRRRS